MSSSAMPSPVTVLAGPRTGLTVAVTTLGTLLSMVAFTAPLPVVPSIAHQLGAGATATAWILSSMSLGLGVALLPAGAIGDVIGRRAVFAAGALLLAAGSVASAVAVEPGLFVAGRIVQGIGAAAVLACGLGILSHAVPAGPRRTHATGVWGAGMGAGPALGPLLGAGADATVGWRPAYVVITVLAAALAVGSRLLPAGTREPRRVDLAGAVLFGGGLACLLTATTEARQGWSSPSTLGPAAAAVVLLALFAVHQWRATAPMLDPRLFRSRALVAATLAAFATGAAVIALMSFLGTALQRGLEMSAFATALLILAWAGVAAAVALLVRRIPESVSGAVRLTGGLVLVALGLVPFALLGPGTPVWEMVLGLAVAGAGTGLLNATLGREAVAAVPAGYGGTGSGINNTSRFVGAAIGVTLVTVVATPAPGADAAAATLAGWDAAVVGGIVGSVPVAAAILLLRRRS